MMMERFIAVYKQAQRSSGGRRYRLYYSRVWLYIYSINRLAMRYIYGAYHTLIAATIYV